MARREGWTDARILRYGAAILGALVAINEFIIDNDQAPDAWTTLFAAGALGITFGGIADELRQWLRPPPPPKEDDPDA